MWVYIEDFKNHVGETVILKGWVFNKRSSGKIHFLQLRDGTGTTQGIMEKAKVEESLFEKAKGLRIESSVEVEGVVREDARSKGGYELDVTGLRILQIPVEEYPITKKEHGTEFLMEQRHLWLRSTKQYHIMKVRNEVIRATRAFYDEQGFTLIDTPIFTGAIGEGAGNLFQLDYFDYGKAYLTQTGQLYLEAACMSFGKVYNLGPTFRAEKSKTRRHLTEFWMNEAEVAYYDFQDNMRLQEELISYIVHRVLENCSESLAILERDTTKLAGIKPPFPRLSYDEAVKMLQDKGHPIRWGDDLGAQDEAEISNQFEKPVMVYKYPTQVKAFYMQPDPQRPEVVLCDDMLAPEGYGEIIGASERIHDYDLLVRRIEENGLPLDSYDWYLDLRKYGSVPHSGFGMGIERTVCWICGIHHIREAIPFARTLYRIKP
ncbi:MAG TPA: asparagine--tRNA ligase [Thermotogota bacterium]|jgi:asparaginyl-tRNA synthetase|nr:asparagine--tRNA ligase [Thermotogota bacterium]NLH19653.1 asparagine--tRNA ligase [Thermotogaceae bacterium]OQC31398.1 MAG: Asparagine--tRNA ligase [Thermotogota bacterium ADurb.Bin062]HNW46444.1 asparagine--tRNA ligase [Thermotogota bacterium]HNY82263.1 asparagine--tRNA ligase [Thermotogota bacterium]